MPRIRDIIVVPIILIPILIYLLIFNRKEKELMLSLSVLIAGVILFRYLNFEVIGAIMITLGTLFLIFVDRDYDNGRLSFITSYTNPIFLKHYDSFVLKLKDAFAPLLEFRYFSVLSEIFYWACTIVWMLVLIMALIRLNRNFPSFLFSLILPIGAFVFAYFMDKK